ncbi:unnamed protein product [Brachionus calyciflorus]|uniref:Uncharacterized protein n=1 Tax=Brachionus calyciflorus TaxID=104777 RepID=A0A814NRQ7_9BILA|nr:unnamed protein product [Brachionus calyciflorus]
MDWLKKTFDFLGLGPQKITETDIENKANELQNELSKIEEIITEYFHDYEFKNTENFNEIKVKVDLRREILKDDALNRIDEYSLGLIKHLECEEIALNEEIKTITSDVDEFDLESELQSISEENILENKAKLIDNLKRSVIKKREKHENLAQKIQKIRNYSIILSTYELKMDEYFGKLSKNSTETFLTEKELMQKKINHLKFENERITRKNRSLNTENEELKSSNSRIQKEVQELKKCLKKDNSRTSPQTSSTPTRQLSNNRNTNLGSVLVEICLDQIARNFNNNLPT